MREGTQKNVMEEDFEGLEKFFKSFPSFNNKVWDFSLFLPFPRNTSHSLPSKLPNRALVF
jgi:hypothetical protein